MPTIERHRTVEASIDVVWDVVTDHDRYGEIAPNLASVEVIKGADAGLVRRCVDTGGNQWTEVCTRWEPGRGFAVAVDVANSGFHRSLFSRFEGEWQVDETAEGVRITIRFDFDPRYGPLGILITMFLRYKAPPIIETIFDRWEAEIRERVETPSDESNGRLEGPNALFP
jgi:ribosome-associated toxin RatA of RatAB toxin-antitoxin module